MALGLFQTPKRQLPRNIGLLSESLAAPSVAKSQAAAQIVQSLAGLPKQIADIREKAIDLKPTKEVAPSIAKVFPDMADVPWGQVKVVLPSLASYRKTIDKPEVSGSVPLLDADGNVVGYAPKGGKFLPGSAAIKEKKTNLGQSINLIDQAESDLEKLPSGLLKGGLAQLAAKTGQVQPDVAAYQRERNALAVKVYRGLTGDSRLSDADAAARALPLIPEIFEARANQKAAWNKLRAAMRGDIPNPLGKFKENKPLATLQEEP